MQFQYNSDYPGLSAAGQAAPPETISRDPAQFPPAQPVPCARITTRVYHPSRDQVATVQNVLVRTVGGAPGSMAAMMGGGGSGGGGATGAPVIDVDDHSLSSNMSSSSSSSDDTMNVDDDAGNLNKPNSRGRGGGVGRHGAAPTTSAAPSGGGGGPDESLCAYWVQRTIREAIYGRVLFAVVLRRRPRALAQADGAEWEVTSDHCAVKEMSWQHIRRERDRLAEDPIKEVSSMQYLQKWYQERRWQRQQQQQQQQELQTIMQQQTILQQQFLLLPPQQQQQPLLLPIQDDVVAESFLAMSETNIMMPLDLLSDERNLYSVMPYCDGGELFERLDMNERFSEEEARYWMDQVLNGLENLQHVGICHRDMSLENLLVHKDGALIIDMGMCLLIPTEEAPSVLAASFDNMNMNGGAAGGATMNFPSPTLLLQQQKQQLSANGPPQPPVQTAPVSGRQRPRYLIRPQGTCGKWIYMSPEVYKNQEPFDGFAVDMWAAGVILFLMLTGFPPWERACQTDERFHYMTAGYLVQMLTEWEIGLSSDAMDLLQRMLFLDPKDRLSLDQVRAHPWMVNGRRAHPLGLSR